MSDIRIGIYASDSSDPTDYKEENSLCPKSQSGNCTYRYDVPGVYNFTSGIIAKSNNFVLAFGGKVIVTEKKDLNVPILIKVKGMISSQIQTRP